LFDKSNTVNDVHSRSTDTSVSSSLRKFSLRTEVMSKCPLASFTASSVRTDMPTTEWSTSSATPFTMEAMPGPTWLPTRSCPTC
jgi:hypothetical protein